MAKIRALRLCPQIIHLSSQHLSLDPHALTTLLSKLFLTLREETSAAVEASQQQMKVFRCRQQEQEKERIDALESSLAVMQSELGA